MVALTLWRSVDPPPNWNWYLPRVAIPSGGISILMWSTSVLAKNLSVLSGFLVLSAASSEIETAASVSRILYFMAGSRFGVTLRGAFQLQGHGIAKLLPIAVD